MVASWLIFFHCEVAIHIKVYHVGSFEWVFFSDHGFNYSKKVEYLLRIKCICLKFYRLIQVWQLCLLEQRT